MSFEIGQPASKTFLDEMEPAGYTDFVKFPMRASVFYFAASLSVPSERVTRLRPRKHLRSLPTRTRPSLFGSD